MEWYEIQSWGDYLAFFTFRGYTLTDETVRGAGQPTAAQKLCDEGCRHYRRLSVNDEAEVLQLRAREAEEKDCGHPPRNPLTEPGAPA